MKLLEIFLPSNSKPCYKIWVPEPGGLGRESACWKQAVVPHTRNENGLIIPQTLTTPSKRTQTSRGAVQCLNPGSPAPAWGALGRAFSSSFSR